MFDQLLTNYHDSSDGDFILMQRNFADKLEVHPLAGSLPEHVPGAARHREYADQLSKEYDLFGKSGGKLPSRNEAQEAIKATATYLCIIAWAKKDPSVLDHVGLEHRERSYARQSEAAPAPPEKISFKNEGKTVWVTILGQPRKSHIELQINDHDPADESAWRMFETFFNSRNEVKGLVRVKEYWFRARFHTASGPSDWSAVVSHVLV
jgi:hypothetical protein